MDIKTYLEHYHTHQTVESYMRAIDHFLFHSKKKEQSSYADIVEYLATHNLRSTRTLSGIKRYFDYLIATGQREDHPCRGLTLKRERKPIQFQELFTNEELELLLSRPSRYPILKDRNTAILSLLIYQGLSPANIANLRTKDIDIDAGTIYIKATTKLTRRTLELKPKQVILLYRYLTESRKQLLNNKTEKLFIGKLGNEVRVDTINKMLRPLQSLFPNKNLNAQTIRKSVIANWLNEQKLPLEDVQLLSGQKWLSTTERYIKPNAEEKRGVINQFFPL